MKDDQSPKSTQKSLSSASERSDESNSQEDEGLSRELLLDRLFQLDEVLESSTEFKHAVANSDLHLVSQGIK